MAQERIGLIGLGHMGHPMAARLTGGGCALTVFDADPDVTARVAQDVGATPAADLAALGQASDIVITMLPTGKIVRAVVTGGLAEALAPGSVIVDMSSSEPAGSVTLAEELGASGLSFVDAPVSGGTRGATDGTLTIMIGAASDEIRDRVAPVLGHMGKRLVPTGGVGTGHAMKALNNYIAGANFAFASEALIIGEQFGLDPAVMVDIINTSTGRNFATEIIMAQQVLSGAFNSGFKLPLLAKDVGIAADLSDQLGTDLPLVARTNEWWRAAEAAGDADDDHTTAFKFWAKAAAEAGS